jgi:hypothetical protein
MECMDSTGALEAISSEEYDDDHHQRTVLQDLTHTTISEPFFIPT